jgi:hypothetical protein
VRNPSSGGGFGGTAHQLAVHADGSSGVPFAGQRLTGEQLAEVVSGLEANELLGDYTHLLTGYLGSPSAVTAVARLLESLKAASPGVQVSLELPLDSWWFPTAGVPGWACGVSGAASRQLVVPHRWGTRLGVWCKWSCLSTYL